MAYVDPPIAALYTNTTMPGMQGDILKPEDKRVDQVLQRGQQGLPGRCEPQLQLHSFHDPASFRCDNCKNRSPWMTLGLIRT